MGNTTYTIYRSVLLTSIAAILFLPATCLSWTKARLSNVQTHLHVQKDGKATFGTDATFIVEAGKFHGFDLAPQKGRKLLAEECYAETRNGKRFDLKIKSLFDERTRIVLDKKQHVKQAEIRFHLVHQTDLLQTGALHPYNGHIRLAWTPIVWDHGMDSMSVSLTTPQGAYAGFDADLSGDYETTKTVPHTVDFKKISVPRWYPMQIVVDLKATAMTVALSPESVQWSPSAGEAAPLHKNTPQLAIERPLQSHPLANWFPGSIGMLLLTLLAYKTSRLRRYMQNLDLPFQFRYLQHTGTIARLVLSMLALLGAVYVQHRGYLSASIPLTFVTYSIWLCKTPRGFLVPRSGGIWRKIDQTELEELQRGYHQYRKQRFSFMDIFSFSGGVTFLLFVFAASFIAYRYLSLGEQQMWSLAIIGLVGISATWGATTSGQLPVNATLESFKLAAKWEQMAMRLLSQCGIEDERDFWLREDDMGPIELRLRSSAVPGDLIGMDIAVETIHIRGGYQSRLVALLKAKAGSATARKLAQSSSAVSHHTTQDRQSEVILLRTRRMPEVSGFTQLKKSISLVG